MPFIRMQLDSVLRLSAFRTVSDPVAPATHMIEGNSPHSFDRRNVDLREVALREGLRQRYEYLNEVYEEMSGYIHLSQHHLIRAVEDWENRDRGEDDEIPFGDLDDLPAWSEDHNAKPSSSSARRRSTCWMKQTNCWPTRRPQ